MPQPTKIPRAFADSGDKNSIPDSSGDIGFASWQEGFPAICSQPFSEGGVAPKRADFNGIFNALSAATVWAQQGGVFAYAADTDYEAGNIVLYNANLYLCLVANGPSTSVAAPTNAAVWGRIPALTDVVPRVGGAANAMTGSLYGGTTGDWFASMNSDDHIFILRGGTTIARGAYLSLYGQDQANNPSKFVLSASGNGSRVELIGATDRSLKWDNNPIVTIEAGTWTPVLRGITTAGSFTFSDNSAYYYKLNNLVFVRFSMTISNCDIQPIGSILLTGLPYSPANNIVDGINVFRAAGGVADSLRRILRFRFGSTGNAYAEVMDYSSGAVVTANFVSSLTSPLAGTTASSVCIATGSNNAQIAGGGFYATDQ